MSSQVEEVIEGEQEYVHCNGLDVRQVSMPDECWTDEELKWREEIANGRTPRNIYSDGPLPDIVFNMESFEMLRRSNFIIGQERSAVRRNLAKLRRERKKVEDVLKDVDGLEDKPDLLAKVTHMKDLAESRHFHITLDGLEQLIVNKEHLNSLPSDALMDAAEIIGQIMKDRAPQTPAHQMSNETTGTMLESESTGHAQTLQKTAVHTAPIPQAFPMCGQAGESVSNQKAPKRTRPHSPEKSQNAPKRIIGEKEQSDMEQMRRPPLRVKSFVHPIHLQMSLYLYERDGTLHMWNEAENDYMPVCENDGPRMEPGRVHQEQTETAERQRQAPPDDTPALIPMTSSGVSPSTSSAPTAVNEFKKLEDGAEDSDELDIEELDRDHLARAVEDAEYLAEKHPVISFNNQFFFNVTRPQELPQQCPQIPPSRILYKQYCKERNLEKNYDKPAMQQFRTLRNFLKTEQMRQVEMGRITVENGNLNFGKKRTRKFVKKVEKNTGSFSFDAVEKLHEERGAAVQKERRKTT